MITINRKTLNYVAYGNSVDIGYKLQNEHNLISTKAYQCNRYLPYVFEYCGEKKRQEELLSVTCKIDKYFRRWNLKPISCKFENIDNLGKVKLGSHVNIRFGLFYDFSLYYPPKVLKELERLEFLTNFGFKRHANSCIGWLLGHEKYDKNGTHWFITNIQTDIKGKEVPSILKEYFRDWHCIILLLTINEAINRGIDNINIVSADALGQRYLKIGAETPVSWKRYYDNNAKIFGFSPVNFKCPVNISIYPWLNHYPHYSYSFYSASREALLHLSNNEII